MRKRTISTHPDVVKRFAKVELRVGNADESDKDRSQFTENPLVSTYPDPSTELDAIFDIPTPVDGRYLTLQTLNEANLEMLELDVFTVR